MFASPNHALPIRLLGRIVRDGYGLGAVVLVAVLGKGLINTVCSNSQADQQDASPSLEEVDTLAG